MSHLKGLLKKEWYLLKRNPVRIFVEFFLPIILGVVINWTNVSGLVRKEHEQSLFDEGYSAGGSAHDDFKSNYGNYGDCKSSKNSELKKLLGLIVEGEDWDTFKNLLDAEMNKDSHGRTVRFQRFTSEDSLLDYAKSDHVDPENDDVHYQVCLGIHFIKKDHKYDYKIFLPDSSRNKYNLKEEIYDELSL